MLDIEVLNKILLSFLGSKESVNKWWMSRNEAFGMKTPRDAYIDDPYKVAQYILDQSNAGGS